MLTIPVKRLFNAFQPKKPQIQATDPRIGLLLRTPVFHGVSPPALQCLLEQSRSIVVPAGSTFFRQGDEATCMYALEAGLAVVSKTWDGHDKTLGPSDVFELGALGAGQCFGDVALIDTSPRTATVQAKTHCQAIEISGHGLYQVYQYNVDEFIKILSNIAKGLCQRLREADEKAMWNATMRSSRSGNSVSGVPSSQFGRFDDSQ